MKKALLLLLVVSSLNTIFFLFNGCHPVKITCGYYTSGSLVPMDNADSLPHAAGAEGVLARAFCLDFIVSDTVYSCMNSHTLLPVNAAYAFRKMSDYTKFMQIDSLTLTSDHDFDTDHPAGADLKALFLWDSSRRISNYLAEGTNHLYLLYPPSDTGTHTFTIRVHQSDSVSSKSFIAISSPVKLLL